MFARHTLVARPQRAFFGFIFALGALAASLAAPGPALATALTPVPTGGEAQVSVMSYATPGLATLTHTTAAARPSAAHAAAAQPHTASFSAVLADTNWGGEPCRSGTYTTGPVYMWKVPPGCYSGVYWVNPRNYVSRSGYGWCNWWPEVLHPGFPNVIHMTRHSTPVPGAVVIFAPGEQGAGSGGHYAEVIAVLGNGWILISEMNDEWRGGGFGRVNYRYVYESPGVTYVY